MKVSSNKRRRTRGKRFEASDLKALVADGRMWVAMGTVFAPDGGSHFDLDGEDCFVEVETHPEGRDFTCRLGAGLGGANAGFWKIPKVGTEVIVVVPSGEETHMPTVVACLATGVVPSELTDSNMIVMNNDGDIVVHPAVAGLIKLGSDAASEAVVKGTTYRTAEDTMLSALVTLLTALQTWLTTWVADTGTLLPVAPTVHPGAGVLNTAVGVANAAIVTFQSAAATYLSTKTKTE